MIVRAIWTSQLLCCCAAGSAAGSFGCTAASSWGSGEIAAQSDFPEPIQSNYEHPCKMKCVKLPGLVIGFHIISHTGVIEACIYS